MSHGSIHEHGHADGGNKAIGLAISIIAILLALATTASNQAKTSEMLTQIKLNDGWSFYQAKRVRRAMLENSTDQLTLTRSILPGGQQAAVDQTLKKYADDINRLKSESNEIDLEAKKIEGELHAIHHKMEFFEVGEILLHISIVLSSITLLISSNWFFRAGVALAALGSGIAAYAFFLMH